MLHQECVLSIVSAPKIQDFIGCGLVIIVDELSHTFKAQSRAIWQLEGRRDLSDAIELTTEAEEHKVVVFQRDQLHG